jgi:hypothetical protein
MKPFILLSNTSSYKCFNYFSKCSFAGNSIVQLVINSLENGYFTIKTMISLMTWNVMGWMTANAYTPLPLNHLFLPTVPHFIYILTSKPQSHWLTIDFCKCIRACTFSKNTHQPNQPILHWCALIKSSVRKNGFFPIHINYSFISSLAALHWVFRQVESERKEG